MSLDLRGKTPREESWTYPGYETATEAEIRALFPDALEFFDVFVGDAFPHARLIIETTSSNTRTPRLRVSVPMTPGRNTVGACIVWLPELKIWRRYSRAVSTRPHRSSLE